MGSTFVLVVFVLALLGVGFQSAKTRSRLSHVLRLDVHPLLARGLKPLNPSASELDAVLATLRRVQWVSAGLLRPDRILAEMQSLRA
jgi:hypothetical protein